MPEKTDNVDSRTDAEPEVTTDAFLLEVVRRWQLIEELQSTPAGASDLADEVDLSRSTVHRATKSLSELNLIEKFDGEFRLTGFGEVVAAETAKFRERMIGSLVLKPFLTHVDMAAVPVEHFTDAVVIQPKPRQPHYSVRRIMELIEETEYLRVFSTVISPFYVEIAHREMLNGMHAEAIFDEQTLEIVLEEYGPQTREVMETGRFEVYVHDDLPFELFLFDEKIGMAAHDENGIARVLVVSSSERAIAWGDQLYDDYLSEARPVTNPSS